METQDINAPRALRDFMSDGTAEAIYARYASLPALAAAADFGDLDRNVVVIDTETTGFSLNHDELTQIAAARMDKGSIVEWFVTFVNPGKPIPEDVAHLTNIHDEDVANAPSPQEALAALVEFVGDAKLVAHNAEFDRNFTTKHPSGYPLLENIWIDSLDLARIALPRLKSHRLIDLVKAFDAPLSTHRADADVEATCSLLRILFAAVKSMPSALVGEISRMATPEQWPTSIVFKHFADETSKEVFSLRALRRERISTLEKQPRLDADDIAADPERSLVFPSKAAIAAAFEEKGLVGALYSDYEPRKEQVAMAQAVRTAFASSENLMVEAGTGVGKSMAYLVPAVLSARRNHIAVGVATKTNALLDQLIYHELPALKDALGDLTYAPLKGFSHYPCLRKIDRIVSEGSSMRNIAGKDYPQAPALAGLLSFIEQSEYDDIDGLKIDYRTVPRWSITTTSQDCLRRKCPYFGTLCFTHGARRRAESVDVVVTNHSLLFCDMAADGGLLPPLRYWVVDEAHGAEAEARRAFSLKISAEELLRISGRAASLDSSRNVFARVERVVGSVGQGESPTLLYALTAKAREAAAEYASAAEEFARHMKDLLFFDPNRRSKGYESVELWINSDIRGTERFATLVSWGSVLSSAIEKLVKACQELVAFLDDYDAAAEAQREVASLAMNLKEMLRAIEIILVKAPECYVYSATLNKKNDKAVDVLEALLLNVGVALEESLYARTHSVVFASATLTVDNDFTAFSQAMGLNASENSVCKSCQLDSSYDYDGHMTVYVANDIPEPTDARYLTELQDFLARIHIAQRGSMLTLFTNRREMEACFDAVQPVLKAEDLRLVCQKWGVSVKGLRDDFLSDEHLSLFALKSFWEGFDAPGSTLRGVVIPKLPFSKPTDPLSCERALRDDQAWRHYVLPAAVLETKQAAGRLIRKASDTGVLVLADRRLVTKSYGKAFLNSMPSKTIKICSMDEIVADIERR